MRGATYLASWGVCSTLTDAGVERIAELVSREINIPQRDLAITISVHRDHLSKEDQ